jgi:hypothetical protein
MSDSSEGVWRDGQLFVVDIARHRFPNTCVKTNDEVGDKRQLLTLSVMGVPWQDFYEAKELIVASSQMPVSTLETRRHNRASIPLQIPLVDNLDGLRRPKRGLRLVASGILATLLAFVSLLAAVLMDSVLLPLAALALLVGLIVTVVGFMMVSNPNGPVLNIKKLTKGMIWVEGAHLLWLDTLPKFVEPPALLQRTYENSRMLSRYLFFMASVVVVTAMMVTGLSIAAHFNLEGWHPAKIVAYVGPLIGILSVPLYVLSKRENEVALDSQRQLDLTKP